MIKLTRAELNWDGTKVTVIARGDKWFALSHIETLQIIDGVATGIRCGGYHSVVVETPEQIMEMMQPPAHYSRT